jgi:anti-sigma factor RsiW
VDGEADAAAAAAVEAHLAVCTLCRAEVAGHRAVRILLRARLGERESRAARGASGPKRHGSPPTGWRRRLTRSGATAAGIVLLIAALEFVSPRSSVLFAAQLAIDHVRCFVVERASTTPADAQQLAAQFAAQHGWTVHVPGSSAKAGITLVAARRCPFWLGHHAHLLYRADGREVSLYITPGDHPRRDEQLAVLGHVERLWTANGSSYALVALGLPARELDRIGSYLERESQKP